MKTFFTADTHFCHANILKYDGDSRPFKTIKEHDEALILNWNNKVSNSDKIYFLGDLCFTKDPRVTESILQRLNGQKFFIKGNHDHSDTIKLYQKYGTYLGEQKKIKVYDEETLENQEIVLNHYSMEVWDKSHHGVWHLFGHSHHSLPDNPHSRKIDVGVNGKGYNLSPLSYEQVKEIMSKKIYKPIDHHTGTR